MGGALLRLVTSLLFPRFCLGCGYVGSYICPSCESGMKQVEKQMCLYCGKRSLFGLTHPRCKRDGGVDGFFSLYRYEGLFKKLLHEAKYRGAPQVLEELLSYQTKKVWLTVSHWEHLFHPAIMSIPLHSQRLRERGFNQSDIIVSAFFPRGERGIYLRRKRNTAHLANLVGARERRAHIRGAFQPTAASLPSAVLLVDDVFTSGATLFECAKTLKQNGVQTVLFFSLAKG